MEDTEFERGDQNFEFAFNSSNFSDRVLRIEILAGSPESKGDGEGGGGVAGGGRLLGQRAEIPVDAAADGLLEQPHGSPHTHVDRGVELHVPSIRAKHLQMVTQYYSV